MCMTLSTKGLQQRNVGDSMQESRNSRQGAVNVKRFPLCPFLVYSIANPRYSHQKGIASRKKARGIEAVIEMAAVAAAVAAGIGRGGTSAAVIPLEKPAIGMAEAAVAEAGGGVRPP